MYIPRPLIVSLLLSLLLVLLVSFLTELPARVLLELCILGVVVSIVSAWVYSRKDQGSAQERAYGPTSEASGKIESMVGELERLRRYHRQILLDLPLGVCALDSGELIIDWNRAMEKMTGIEHSTARKIQLTELPEPWLSLLHNFVTSEYTHLYKQSFDLKGKKHTVNLHKSLIEQPVDAKSAGGGILILLEDITETEILEAGLTHSERLASIGRLAAGVAHEIGNPITGIACLAQNIRDEFQDPELQNMARQIVEQTERTSRIVQSLVSFAHAGSSSGADMTEIITLRDCIDEAITLVSLDKKGKSMRYEVRCEPDIRIKGDSQRLLQVLLNLINNSRDASQPDGKIQMCCDEFGEWIRVVVEDEGVGISADVIDRVFDPFFTTKEAGKGTGLGLSLVYSIVEDLQGNIDIISPAQSNPGRGTRVVLTFPGLGRKAATEQPALASSSGTDTGYIRGSE